MDKKTQNGIQAGIAGSAILGVGITIGALAFNQEADPGVDILDLNKFAQCMSSVSGDRVVVDLVDSNKPVFNGGEKIEASVIMFHRQSEMPTTLLITKLPLRTEANLTFNGVPTEQAESYRLMVEHCRKNTSFGIS